MTCVQVRPERVLKRTQSPPSHHQKVASRGHGVEGMRNAAAPGNKTADAPVQQPRGARAAGQHATQLQCHACKPYKEADTPTAITIMSPKGLTMSTCQHFIEVGLASLLWRLRRCGCETQSSRASPLRDKLIWKPTLAPKDPPPSRHERSR